MFRLFHMITMQPFNNNYEPIADTTSETQPMVVIDQEHEAPDTQSTKCKAISGSTMYDARVVLRDIPDLINDGDIVLRVTSTTASMKSGKSLELLEWYVLIF